MADSYTRSNPVALTLECQPCHMTIGANDVRPAWVDLFRAAHSHNGPVFFRCLPCSEGHHRACGHTACECECRKDGDRAA